MTRKNVLADIFSDDDDDGVFNTMSILVWTEIRHYMFYR